MNVILMFILTPAIPIVINKYVDKTIFRGYIVIPTLLYWLLACYFSESSSELLIAIIFGAMIIIEIYIDYWMQEIIPIFIYGAMGISSIIYMIIKVDLLEQILNSMFAFLGYFVLYILARWYYKEEAFGFGDVLLIFGIGFFIRRSYLVLVMLLPFYLALIHLIILKIRGTKLERTLRIPFGPYMGVAAIILYFIGPEILDFVNFLFMR